MRSKLLSLFAPRASKGRASEFKKLEKILGYGFKSKKLLQAALVHKSYLRTGSREDINSSYERLEFLGDAVLGLVVSEFLYKIYPLKTEGELTKIKATLVNEVTLSRRALEINLGEFLLLSPEEEKSGGRKRESILADACEGIIGAAYLDGGIKGAQKIITRLILDRHKESIHDRAQHNHKGDLLEYVQARGWGMPRYEVEITEGPDHKKTFTIAAWCQGKRLGVGQGASKKEAEQHAARMALQALKAEKTKTGLVAQKLGSES